MNRTESPRLAPTVRKIGNSLSDLPRSSLNGTAVQMHDGKENHEVDEQRRNSWSNGIPKIKEKLSARSTFNGKTLARKNSEKKTVGSVISALTGRGIRRSSSKVVPATREAKRDSAAQTPMSAEGSSVDQSVQKDSS
ncbi:uncharacterized protein LOC135370407 [Ornithodoros turicata]|uniref:uncharacterized protein LOC135370407 n=1 Tax=Ornithodoros turicata TaxID=34597 RepID=UPI003139166A